MDNIGQRSNSHSSLTYRAPLPMVSDTVSARSSCGITVHGDVISKRTGRPGWQTTVWNRLSIAARVIRQVLETLLQSYWAHKIPVHVDHLECYVSLLWLRG